MTGNYNAGKGARSVFDSVQEMRGQNGARLYFTKSGNDITILAYSDKANQDAIIKTSRKLYE